MILTDFFQIHEQIIASVPEIKAPIHKNIYATLLPLLCIILKFQASLIIKPKVSTSHPPTKHNTYMQIVLIELIFSCD